MARPPVPDAGKRKETPREWLLLLARDLAIFGLIFGIALGTLFAYSMVWPPLVVVESQSMQHSDTESFIGVIDTGDYVIVRATPVRTQIVTWVEGRVSSYRTYGDFGDVIIFRPPPQPADVPIIHRAIVWLEWNTTTGDGWDAPSLLALPSTEWRAEDRNGNPLSAPYNINGAIILYNASFDRSVTLTIPLFARQPQRSGFISMGDNNADSGGADSWVVPLDHVIGQARGELPWFGLLKLTIAPASGCCQGWGDPSAPQNSWNALAVSLVALVVVPVTADYGLSWWLKHRKEKGPVEAQEDQAAESDSAAGPGSEASGEPPRDPLE